MINKNQVYNDSKTQTVISYFSMNDLMIFKLKKINKDIILH